MSQDVNNLVVVPDGDSEKLGIQLHWRLAGEFDQEVMNAALRATGLPAHLFPTPPGDAIALKRAMSVLKTGNRDLIRSLARSGGYSLVKENPEALDLEKEGEDDYDPTAPPAARVVEEPKKESHIVSLTAKVMKDGTSSSHRSIVHHKRRAPRPRRDAWPAGSICSA